MMGVWLKNFQQKITFNQSLLRLHCSFLLHAVGAGQFDVSVVCVDNKYIQHLNSVYRGVDKATDVLSFPYHEDIKPGILPRPTVPHDFNLGDIILGMPVIVDQCRWDNVTLQHRLPVLVTHGLCHLLGYRHNSPSLAEQMYKKERATLSAFNNAFGTTLTPLVDY